MYRRLHSCRAIQRIRLSFLGGATLILSALLLYPAHPAKAQTKTWDAGGATADWGALANWNADTLPTITDNILFNNSAQTPLENIYLGAFRSVNSLTLNLTAAANQNWSLGAATNSQTKTLSIATGTISVLSTSGTGTYIIGATSGTSLGTATMLLSTTGTGFTLNNDRTNGGILQINAIIGNATSQTVTKTGAGTVVLTGGNGYTGATIVNAGTLTLAGLGPTLSSTSAITVHAGGTLLLAAHNQINNTAPITLNGGTFARGTFSEGSWNTAGVGALTLTGTGSRLDFGTGEGQLTFASFNPGSFTLIIDNWTDGFTQGLIFASDQTANLSRFSFTGFGTGATQIDLGGGYYQILANEFVEPVPEPSTYVAGTLALFAIGFQYRRRLRRRRHRRWLPEK